MKYIVTRDTPDAPSGTVLTLVGNQYQSDAGAVFAKNIVESKTDFFKKLIQNNVPTASDTFFYIDLAHNTVRTYTGTNTIFGELDTLVATHNYFPDKATATQKLANIVANLSK